MKKSIFILMAVVLGMTACNDVEQIEKQQTNNSSILAVQDYQNLSSSDIQQLANLHNTFLGEVETSLDWNSNDMSGNIETNMMALNSNDLTSFSTAEKQSYLDFAENNSNINFLSNHYGSEAMSIFNNAEAFLLSNEDFTLSELQSHIALSYTEATNHLSGLELDGVLVFLAVLEKSAIHWLPVDRGGSGSGDATIAVNDKVKNANFWGELLLADAKGATAVFIGIGLTLLATPPTAAALAGVVGWASATASLWSLV